MPNINFITCPKLRYRAPAPKIDPLPTFHKLVKRDSIYKFVFLGHRRTYMLSIKVLECSKAEI